MHLHHLLVCFYDEVKYFHVSDRAIQLGQSIFLYIDRINDSGRIKIGTGSIPTTQRVRHNGVSEHLRMFSDLSISSFVLNVKCFSLSVDAFLYTKCLLLGFAKKLTLDAFTIYVFVKPDLS